MARRSGPGGHTAGHRWPATSRAAPHGSAPRGQGLAGGALSAPWTLQAGVPGAGAPKVTRDAGARPRAAAGPTLSQGGGPCGGAPRWTAAQRARRAPKRPVQRAPRAVMPRRPQTAPPAARAGRRRRHDEIVTHFPARRRGAHGRSARASGTVGPQGRRARGARGAQGRGGAAAAAGSAPAIAARSRRRERARAPQSRARSPAVPFQRCPRPSLKPA
jgi:hypothetical protein